jgi:hypothetical protein
MVTKRRWVLGSQTFGPWNKRSLISDNKIAGWEEGADVLMALFLWVLSHNHMGSYGISFIL